VTTQTQLPWQESARTGGFRFVRQSDGYCFGCRRTGRTHSQQDAPWCDECTEKTMERSATGRLRVRMI